MDTSKPSPLLVGDDQQEGAALLDERHRDLIVAVRPPNGTARGDSGSGPLGRGQSNPGWTEMIEHEIRFLT